MATALYIFAGRNVISAGEIFSTVGYPVIDLARGGSIQGEIRALNHLLELTVPEIAQEGGTMESSDTAGCAMKPTSPNTVDMVTIVRDRIARPDSERQIA